jgi:hypothetical protein
MVRHRPGNTVTAAPELKTRVPADRDCADLAVDDVLRQRASLDQFFVSRYDEGM